MSITKIATEFSVSFFRNFFKIGNLNLLTIIEEIYRMMVKSESVL
jgi:hypothetical protein